ncbi:chromatin remodeling protein [Encephalitozoon hellem]|uniref:Chromatin remodeling protein n=1 Tax=Encephalitozoon hellem TaxID=27973 RepID=A0ABY8CL76_ENCHE|nr:chromatin remodeling protein [Encephalitozoon hellem]
MQSHFEVFDKMLEEVQQLRLDAIYFTKLTSRMDGRIEKLRKKCRRYKEKFIRRPLERYAKRIAKCHKAVKKLLRNNRDSGKTFGDVVTGLKKRCEELCSRAEASFDLEHPSISDMNCVVNLGEMGKNEKLYCRCGRPPFKSMIACDSPDCVRKWFHFECVGLASTPRAPWTCPECRKAAALND